MNFETSDIGVVATATRHELLIGGTLVGYAKLEGPGADGDGWWRPVLTGPDGPTMLLIKRGPEAGIDALLDRLDGRR